MRAVRTRVLPHAGIEVGLHDTVAIAGLPVLPADNPVCPVQHSMDSHLPRAPFSPSGLHNTAHVRES